MSEKYNGGPAFPIPGDQCDESFNGMTLRDYFAAKVLQGAMTTARNLGGAEDSILVDMGKQCYRIADAMLEARK